MHRSWLDRDEKVVVMQTVRDQISQHVFTAIAGQTHTPVYC